MAKPQGLYMETQTTQWACACNNLDQLNQEIIIQTMVEVEDSRGIGFPQKAKDIETSNGATLKRKIKCF